MIKLELEIDEVNYILLSLGDRPFKESAPLVNKIHMQASPQVPAKPLGIAGDTEQVHTHQETRTIMGNTETVIVEDAK